MRIPLYQRIRYGAWWRVWDILSEAPWSNYDLLASLIVLGVGIYLQLYPEMFGHIGGVYRQMAEVASARQWGGLFLGCGSFGLAVVLWCRAPAFIWRLTARMAVAFCLLVLASNNALNTPPPLSTITYVLLSLWSVWGILRTRGSGR